MILLVDHQDSFTRNLEHLLARFDQVIVKDRLDLSDHLLQSSTLIVLSPGPGKPSDYPETLKLARKLIGKVPILGICLGFQLLLELEGARIIRQSKVLHGVCTEISTVPESITYQGFSQSIQVARYHSLQVDPASLSALPNSIRMTAHDSIRNVPLSFEDLKRKLFGLQYHPESFLSNQGTQILSNILHESMEQR